MENKDGEKNEVPMTEFQRHLSSTEPYTIRNHFLTDHSTATHTMKPHKIVSGGTVLTNTILSTFNGTNSNLTLISSDCDDVTRFNRLTFDGGCPTPIITLDGTGKDVSSDVIIRGVQMPERETDATNKKYVDDLFDIVKLKNLDDESTYPKDPMPGMMFYNRLLKVTMYWNESEWVKL